MLLPSYTPARLRNKAKLSAIFMFDNPSLGLINLFGLKNYAYPFPTKSIIFAWKSGFGWSQWLDTIGGIILGGVLFLVDWKMLDLGGFR